jgi:hypothetical protein
MITDIKLYSGARYTFSLYSKTNMTAVADAEPHYKRNQQFELDTVSSCRNLQISIATTLLQVAENCNLYDSKYVAKQLA